MSNRNLKRFKNIYMLCGIHFPVLILFLVIMGTTVASVNKKLNEEGGYVAGNFSSVHGDIYMDVGAEGNTVAEITKELKDGKMHVTIEIYDGAGNRLELINKIRDSDEYLKLLETKNKKKVETTTGNTDLTDDRSGTGDTTETPGENFSSRLTVQETTANAYRIISESAVTDTVFIVSVNKENGNLYIENNYKKLELGIEPDIIAQKALNEGKLNYIGHLYIKSSPEHDLEYTVEGTRKASFLGLFDFDVPQMLHYDAVTGESITKEENLMDSLFFGFFKRDSEEL